MMQRTLSIVGLLMAMGARVESAQALDLSNPTLSVRLGTLGNGVPCLLDSTWLRDKRPVLQEVGPAEAASLFLPTGLSAQAPSKDTDVAWQPSEDAVFHRAEATRSLARGLKVIWTVELSKAGTVLRLGVRMHNTGTEPCPIEWFPAWSGLWQMPEGIQNLRAWQALSFKPLAMVPSGREVTFKSRLHSSDTEHGSGMNPYWVVRGKDASLCFALSWCGGWEAKLRCDPKRLAFRVRLPEDETQLVLRPGEQIVGPMLYVTLIRQTDDDRVRAEWMRQRADLAAALYGGPKPSYPFCYNNWYVTRFDFSADFLRRQVAAMDPYTFDAFVVDAGWYECVGKWTPSAAKFKPGEFEDILKAVDGKKVAVGIWTCPQFLNAPKDALPPEVDRPGLYERFIGGHLLDLVGSNYPRLLTEHVKMLRERYGARWWKYDQILFASQTRCGIMRNVIAFQEALQTVRKANPDLFIENCQSGGRMTNELTVLATQGQWLRDGGDNGLRHARSNVEVALRAMEFLFPWTCERWTNNLQGMDPADDDLTRFYCRSAMAGSWGMVSDLSKIPDRQRVTILAEVRNYRRLSPFKAGYLYDLTLPDDKADVASVTFYNPTGDGAAILLYRWNGKGAIERWISLPRLSGAANFKVENVDAARTIEEKADALRQKGLCVQLAERQLSSLVFVQAAR